VSIGFQDSAQMRLAQDDEMVDALAPDRSDHPFGRHCQSKFVYFAKASEPDFVAIDFPAFFRVDLSGSMAAPSI
jgi:hypothetical protein